MQSARRGWRADTAARLGNDAAVETCEGDGRAVVEPVREREASPGDLAGRITDAEGRGAADHDEPVGGDAPWMPMASAS